MSILDAARAAKAQQHAKNQSSLSQHLAHAKKWIDRSGVALSDVADGKVTKQELTRPEDSAKAAQQVLQGDEDDDADEHEAWESRLSRPIGRFYILRERSSPTLTSSCYTARWQTSMAHWLSVSAIRYEIL